MDEPIRSAVVDARTPNQVEESVRMQARAVLRDYIGVLLRIEEDAAAFNVTVRLVMAANALAELDGVA